MDQPSLPLPMFIGSVQYTAYTGSLATWSHAQRHTGTSQGLPWVHFSVGAPVDHSHVHTYFFTWGILTPSSRPTREGSVPLKLSDSHVKTTPTQHPWLEKLLFPLTCAGPGHDTPHGPFSITPKAPAHRYCGHQSSPIRF